MSFEFIHKAIIDHNRIAQYAIDWFDPVDDYDNMNEDDWFDLVADSYIEDYTMHYCDCFQILYEVWDGDNITIENFDLRQFARDQLRLNVYAWKSQIIKKVKGLKGRTDK